MQDDILHVIKSIDNNRMASATISMMTAVNESNGKFAGLTGTMTIRSRRLNPLTDGAVQVVGEKLGSCSFQNAVAAAK